jgi:hypothetical protein
MSTIAHLQSVVQTLFTTTANQVARQTGFIRRQRKLTGAQFLQATVFGWLQHARATRHQLYQSLCLTGADLSLQAFDQRFSPQAVRFLRAMLDQALRQVVEAQTLCPILARFHGVYLTDTTRLDTLDLKIAARLELQRGQLQLSLETLTCHDNASALCAQALPIGALHIADLGFYDLEQFLRWSQAGVDWISRYKVGTRLAWANGQPVDLQRELSSRRRGLIRAVLVGVKQVPMYLYAQPVRASVLHTRLLRLRRLASRKQRPLTSRQIFLAGWSLYLSSVSDLTFAQVHALYRTRWQIEGLFKRWKSLGGLGHSTSQDQCRRTCEGLAKILAVLLIQWMCQLQGWSQSHISRQHLFRMIQQYGSVLQRALFRDPCLWSVVQDIWRDLQRANTTPCRSKHPKACQFWDLFDVLA